MVCLINVYHILNAPSWSLGYLSLDNQSLTSYNHYCHKLGHYIWMTLIVSATDYLDKHDKCENCDTCYLVLYKYPIITFTGYTQFVYNILLLSRILTWAWKSFCWYAPLLYLLRTLHWCKSQKSFKRIPRRSSFRLVYTRTFYYYFLIINNKKVLFKV